MRGLIVAWMALALAVACGGKTVVTPLPGWTFPGPGGGVTQQKIDKVDLLFAIDGSSSMGDAQGLLAQAVPVLVNRLLAPNCVDATGIACTSSAQCSSLGPGAQCELSSGSGRCYVPSNGTACPAGTKQEFSPVHDLHIGIVSSSLGGGGSPDVCVPAANGDPSHQDDEGHLLNRTKPATVGGPEGVVNDAKPLDGNGGNFLAWLPMSNPSNAGKTPPNVTSYGDGQQTQLLTDFQSLVTGVQNHGCGLQAPLESWYRFLVQPDPYDAITTTGGAVPQAQLEGVDSILLKMRHDFLRPDSLVAIVQLTGRDDRWSDPLWGGGYGWTARTENFPGGPGQGVGPRGTSECDAPVDPNNVANTGPNDPDCTSCAFTGNKPVSGQPIASDPNCQSCAAGASCPQKGWYTVQQDGLNVRYTDDMKRRYGLDPQWNVQRYVDGLTLPTVPDRDNEAHGDYGQTVRNCTNPLFAQNLPDGSDTSHDTLCNLQPGSRTPDLVFYALIGGVPNELLDDPSGNFKPSLGADDWTRILGKDPSSYQLDGIDPHMIESIAPRASLQAPGASYTLGTDPDHGREWNTLTSPAGIDLQYACTYQLPVARDCTQPQNAGVCDCVATATSAPDGPPLCDPANRNMQIRGKAYPTIRELRVAKGLGKQAVVASLCARDTNPADAVLPTYGYNPAMQGIVNRLRTTLGGECLPGTLPVTADGTSSCVVLVVFGAQTDQASGCTLPGYAQPPADLLQLFRQQWASQQGNATVPTPVLCQLRQLAAGTDYAPPSCDLGATNPPGWCYVQNDPVSGCGAEVRFSPQGEPPAGTSVTLACPTTP